MASRAIKIDPEKIESRSATSQPMNETVQPAVSDNDHVDEKEIAILAYQLWLERGCPIGSDQEDWFRAERKLAGANRTDEKEERSMADTEEPASTMLRFPIRSEIIQASGQTALLKRA